MRQPVFLLQAGLPGAGKTTLREKIVRAWPGPISQLSTDDAIDAAAKVSGKTYNEVFAGAIEEATEAFNFRLASLIELDASLIVDQTNTTAKKRRSVLARVPRHYLKVCIVSEVAEDERQRRLASRPGKVIPPHVDAAMRERWEHPTTDEGFDAVLLPPAFDDVDRAIFWIEDMTTYA